MPREYHNYSGLMRDLRALALEGDERYYEFFEFLVEGLSDVGAALEPADAEDDGDLTVDDTSLDMASEGLQGREADAPRPRRHDARGTAHSAAPGGVGRELAPVPGSQRASSESDVVDVRTGDVGAPCYGVKRVGTVELTLAELNALQAAKRVPRGTRAAKKKGVKRGTRKATRK